jgi:RHS repeat-associated protein
MDGQKRVALVETRTQGNEPGVPEQLIRYQYDNHIGSACLELDHLAAVITYEEYTPFGSTSYQAVRSQTETPKRYRYGGKERDEESGLNYHNARYCVTWLGRWLNPDPLGIKDGPNVYAYSRNNPIRFSDPSGTECNDRDISTCPAGRPAPPPTTTGTLLPSADANGGGPPRTPPPPELPARHLQFWQLQSDWFAAIGDSSRNFQLRGGLLSPEYRASSYPVTGTDQILPSLGRAFKIIWGEHPQLQADTKDFGLRMWNQHGAAAISFGVLGLLGAAGAAAGGEWQPLSLLPGLATLMPEQSTRELATGPASPGDMFFRRIVFNFNDSTTIGQNEGRNAFGLAPTLQFRGGYLNRDLTITTGLNARYLPDLRQFRLQESLGIDQNLVRFNIGPYDASLQLSGRVNFYQQMDTQGGGSVTPLTPEGTFGLQFRIFDRPTPRRSTSPSPTFIDRPSF